MHSAIVMPEAGTTRYLIPVEPTAKGRPRVTKKGHTYTPDKTVDAEERIKWHLRQQGAQVSAAPLSVVMVFTVARPKKPKHKEHVITRPDLDQYIKLLLDAGNGLLWADDSQVVALKACKGFGAPCIVLEVTEL